MVVFEGFKKYPIVYGVATRHSTLDDFLKKIGVVNSRLAFLEQIHRAKVLRIDSKTDLSAPLSECDGAVTDLKNIAMIVLTADCLPIFLYDPFKSAIGIAHAGWRGTYDGIVKNILNAMKLNFKSDPSQMLIGLGPAIRQCCYEVSSEFLGRFPNSVVKRAHKFYFDLVGENVEQLLAQGASSKNIFDCEICTSCSDDRFYSYRRENERAGRMASVIMLKEKG
ncbi:MAG: peptidoglycan editing factor PgeF [Candidatus Omnitrophota bacterium]